jgi:hypothetical protein
MPDAVLHLPGSLSVEDLLVSLRDQEDFAYKLTGFSVNRDTGENYFEFDPTIDDPLPPEEEAGDPSSFLKLYKFAQPPVDAAAGESYLQAFRDYGGQPFLAGTIKLASADSFVVFYRGADPEFPQPHAETPPAPPQPFIPEDARRAFDPGQALANVPLRQASTMRMSLKGLKDSVISYFQDESGKVDAFVMITDADIDTDGPGGSKHNDPWYQPETSLVFPGGKSCNSREFPGVVRSVRLREQLGLKLGDFAYIYYQGKAVACQIYDQGADDKIGEISIYAARQAGVISPTMSEAAAATKGNSVRDLITLCFPGSCPKHRALPNKEIVARAQECLTKLIGRLKGADAKPATLAQPVVVEHPALAAGGQPPSIYQRSAWGAMPPKVRGFRAEGARGIVIHNTQSPNRAPKDTEDAEKRAAFGLSLGIQHSHMDNNGWSDIGQHFTVSRGGIIMEARAGTLEAAREGKVVCGAHAGVNRYNRSWWGIETEGDFRFDSTKITDEQITALTALCRWLGSLIQGFDPSQHIKGHREVHPGGTDCPGLLLDNAHPPDFLTRLRQALE